MKKLVVTSIMLLILIIAACNKEEISSSMNRNSPQLPVQTLDYNVSLHPRFHDTINNEMATLGRVLFYDKKLSTNNSVACASCHKQHLAFSDNTAFSKGVNITKTLRNSPPISNIFGYSSFFWDSRSSDLKEMVLMPVQDHIEMGFRDLDNLVLNLESQPYYKELFQKAYGSEEIDEERIANSLTEFLRSLSSFNSKYDKGRDSDFGNFTSKELRGKDLFFGKANCSQCHSRQINLDGGGLVANIGLDLDYADKGVGEISGEPQNYGEFKVPGLRNVAITAPYMHDGRFSTLEEVVNHYSDNIQPHENLDWRLTEALNQNETDINRDFGIDGFEIIDNWWTEPENGGVPVPLNLTSYEKSCLIEFLKTLTDNQYLHEEKYSNPFN